MQTCTLDPEVLVAFKKIRLMRNAASAAMILKINKKVLSADMLIAVGSDDAIEAVQCERQWVWV
jgi:hypothetical protein